MPFVVNGELIEESEIRKEASLLRPQFEQVMTDLDPVEAERQLWEWSRENVIEKALLRQEALRSGVSVTEEEILHAIQAMRPYQTAEAGGDTEAGSDCFKRDVETQIRVERLLAGVAESAKTPDKKAVTDFYRKHRDCCFLQGCCQYLVFHHWHISSALAIFQCYNPVLCLSCFWVASQGKFPSSTFLTLPVLALPATAVVAISHQ